MRKNHQEEEFDARIVLVGIDKDGNRNARLHFEFNLVTPLEDLIADFQKAFRRTFVKNHVSFECTTTFIPLGIDFHWKPIENLAFHLRDFLLGNLDIYATKLTNHTK